MTTSSEVRWEDDLGVLLRDITDAQGRLLQLLQEKQRLLAKGDLAAVALLAPREQELLAELEKCHARRGKLLDSAAAEGRAHENLRAVSASLPARSRQSLQASFQRAESAGRLLRHQSLSNWVLAQRSLLHLAHLLEIIATGGQRSPTYDQGATSFTSGALMDQTI